MSETPRTDAELQVVVVGDDYSGMVEFARQLERELREAEKEIARLNSLFDKPTLRRSGIAL